MMKLFIHINCILYRKKLNSENIQRKYYEYVFHMNKFLHKIIVY